MFDTMTITKAFASVCGAMLVLLLGGWAAESLYNIDTHGDDHVSGYAILVDDGGEEEVAEEVIEVAFADVYAVADASAGERLWRQCGACHQLNPGANAVGPYLHGVVGLLPASTTLPRWRAWVATGHPRIWPVSSRTRAAMRPEPRCPTTACVMLKIAQI
jgi:hypothetical protein